MFSRRNFLQLSGTAVVGGLVLGSNINVLGQRAERSDYFPVPATAYSDNVNSFSRQTFDPLIDTSFSLTDPDEETALITKGGAATLRLVEVVGDEKTKKYLARKPIDSFSLIFEGNARNRLGDKIYTFTHPQLGTFSMFISTVGMSGNRYQAAFSRLY